MSKAFLRGFKNPVLELKKMWVFLTLACTGFMSKEKEWKHLSGLLGAYRAFIVLWIVFGLGYLAMILSFITRAMRSSRLRRLEQKLARRIKSTRLWQAGEIGYLRRVLNELYLLKFKVQNGGHKAVSRSAALSRKGGSLKASSLRLKPPAYSFASSRRASSLQLSLSSYNSSCRCSRLASSRTYAPSPPQPVYRARRSLAAAPGGAYRGRSRSLALPEPPCRPPPRSLSEACLDLIDRDATFAAAPRRVDAADLLATVAAAAASVEERDAGAHHGLPDEDILADEAPPSRRGSLFGSFISRKSSMAPAPPTSRRGSLMPAALSRMTSPAQSRRGSLVNGDARRLRGCVTTFISSNFAFCWKMGLLILGKSWNIWSILNCGHSILFAFGEIIFSTLCSHEI